MPVEMERELRAEFRKNHPEASSKEEDAYVYGTMRKTGWKPERQQETFRVGTSKLTRWRD